MSTEQFILDIEWNRPSSESPVLSPLVGPFDSRAEAREWGRLNIPNGSWECRPIAYPYMRSPSGLDVYLAASPAPADHGTDRADEEGS